MALTPPDVPPAASCCIMTAECEWLTGCEALIGGPLLL